MDERMKELVAIGASVGAHCKPCLEHHVSRAREMDIAEEEIKEAVEIGHRIEKGAMSAMRDISSEVIEEIIGEGESMDV